MKCPYCKYEDFTIDKKGVFKEGKSGNFFQLPITMNRRSLYDDKEEQVVYGCPNCRKIFMSTF